MDKMNWTAERPDEAGYYWANKTPDSLFEEVVLLYFDGNSYWWEGDIIVSHMSFRHFMGPLEVPNPPEVSP
jgi:hypothetical protein